MGSTKSLRYEVLVYPPKEQLLQQPNSSNSVSQQLMFQTQAQRFSCDRENTQQYWIPDGFRPVLVHRDLLKSSLASTNDVDDSRQMTSTASAVNVSGVSSNLDVSPPKQRTAVITHNAIIDGGTANRSKRRRILGSSKGQLMINPRISPRLFNTTALYYKVKCKELMEKGIISNPPIDPPSKIIGNMWYEEPENVKKYYEKLAHKMMIEQARKRSRNPTYKHQLNNVNRNDANSSPHVHESRIDERSMVQRTPGLATSKHHRSVAYNINVSPTSSENFTKYHVLNKSVISCDSSSKNSDKIFAEQHQNSLSANNQHEDPLSSSKLSATQTTNFVNLEEDYLTCNAYDEYDNCFDKNGVVY